MQARQTAGCMKEAAYAVEWQAEVPGEGQRLMPWVPRDNTTCVPWVPLPVVNPSLLHPLCTQKCPLQADSQRAVEPFRFAGR